MMLLGGTKGQGGAGGSGVRCVGGAIGWGGVVGGATREEPGF